DGPRIMLVDEDAVDGLRLGQAHVTPRPATVQRTKYALPGILGIARVAFARPDPNLARIPLVDPDRTDGERGLLIEDGRPPDAAGPGFPYAAGRRADIDVVGIRTHDIDRGDATTHPGRAYAAKS